MPDQDQIQESPGRHQKLQHLHDLMVGQAIKALETEDQPNASMLRTCLEVLKANDVDVNALEDEDPSTRASSPAFCSLMLSRKSLTANRPNRNRPTAPAVLHIADCATLTADPNPLSGHRRGPIWNQISYQ
jgi:hypothetical protein